MLEVLIGWQDSAKQVVVRRISKARHGTQIPAVTCVNNHVICRCTTKQSTIDKLLVPRQSILHNELYMFTFCECYILVQNMFQIFIMFTK